MYVFHSLLLCIYRVWSEAFCVKIEIWILHYYFNESVSEEAHQQRVPWLGLATSTDLFIHWEQSRDISLSFNENQNYSKFPNVISTNLIALRGKDILVWVCWLNGDADEMMIVMMGTNWSVHVASLPFIVGIWWGRIIVIGGDNVVVRPIVHLTTVNKVNV